MIKTPWHSRLAFALALALPVYFAIAALGTKFGLWDWRTGLLTLTIKAGPILLGIVVAFGWAFFTALVMYMLVSLLTGLRAPALHEQRGLDLSEHAESGYPEFPQNTLYNSELTRSAESRP